MMEPENVPAKAGATSLPLILLLATDPGVLKMLHMALHIEDAYDLLAFTTSTSALEAAKRIKPDLIIIHSLLLGQQALRWAAQFHQLQGRERVPVLLTHAPVASSGQEPESHLIVLGQPFTVAALYAAVQQCLGRFIPTFSALPNPADPQFVARQRWLDQRQEWLEGREKDQDPQHEWVSEQRAWLEQQRRELEDQQRHVKDLRFWLTRSQHRLDEEFPDSNRSAQ